MTVDELFNEWIDCYQKDQIKIQTYVRYKSLYKFNIQPLIGERNIEDLQKREMQVVMNKIKTRTSERTGKPLGYVSVNMCLTLMNMMFEYAVDFDLLEANPCSRVRGISAKDKRKVIAFTKEEQVKIEKFVEETNNDEYFGIILDLYTGLRIGELLALEWGDIDLREGFMCINKTVFTTVNEKGEWRTVIDTPKTRTSNREIPLPDWIIKRLKKLKDKAISRMVVCKNDGSRMSTKLYRWRYNEMLEKLEIEPHHFHALRHTFATRALENGMDVRTLADILGHANANVTLNVYAHSMTEHKRHMMNNMQRVTVDE
jgi:integrase